MLAPPTTPADRQAPPSWCVPAIVVASLAVTALYAGFGTGFVLDDWFTLGEGSVVGPFEAAGAGAARDRPGAYVVYLVVFGGLGAHPGAVLAFQGAVALATGLVLFALVRRFVAAELAAATAIVWVLLPSHTSLEVWASASNIAVALLALLVGLLVLVDAGSDRGWALGGAVLAVGVLCYEAVLPAAVVGAVALPWLRDGAPRWRAAAFGVGGPALATLWILAHWHDDKQAGGLTDLSQVVGGNLGWGIAPDGVLADVLALVALVGIAVAVGRLALERTRRRAGPGEAMVLVGVVVAVLGAVPFAFYFYAPLGAGDRFNVVSAVGAALIWTGIGAMAWRVRRELALAGAALLVVGAGPARWERADRWSRAGADALAILDAIEARWPEPPDHPIVLGPRPVQEQNVAAFLDQSNVRTAVQHLYGVSGVEVVLVFDQAAFDAAPEDQRLDIVELSSLEATDEVEPT